MTFDLFVKPNDMTVMRFCRKDACAEEYMAFPYGSKIKVEAVEEKYGGGAHNTAVSLRRLGADVMPIGCIGGDAYGKKVLENLEKEHIANTLLQRDAMEKTGFSVIITSFEGERTVFGHAGANAHLADFDADILTNCSAFYCNHLSSAKNQELLFKKIKRHFLQYPEKFLAWNPGKEQLSQGALAFADFFPVVDLLILNREEAELFTGRKARKNESKKEQTSQESIVDTDYSSIFGVFVAQGARNIVITDGRKGAQLCDGENIYFCGIDHSLPRVDTLGAGDAFGSTLFYLLFREKELSFALKCATINAASVVAQVGAQTGLLSFSELIERAKKQNLQQHTYSFSG